MHDSNTTGFSLAKHFFGLVFCTDKGVIYEDDTIGVRFETRRVKYCVELKLVFLNKTKRSMSSLSCTLYLPAELEVSSDTYVEATVEAGGEAHAQFNIECLEFFYEQPQAKLKFDVNNQPRCKIYIDLPIHVNKFMAPKKVDRGVFNRRWKECSVKGEQDMLEFWLPMEMNVEKCFEDLLLGFGFRLLSNVASSSSTMYVGAGVIRTKSRDYECFIKVKCYAEENKSAKKYRFFAKSSYHSKLGNGSDYLTSVLREEKNLAMEYYFK